MRSSSAVGRVFPLFLFAACTEDVAARINDVAAEDLRFCELRPLLLPAFDIQRGNVQVE